MRRSSTRRRRCGTARASPRLGAFVLAGCGGTDSSATRPTTADAGPCGTTDRHHADRRPVRHLRLQGGGSLGRLQEGLPQHHDQGGRRRAVGRLLDAAQDAPRVRQRSRRRPGDRDRLRRRRRAEPRGPVRQLEQRAQRRRGQGGVLPLEVAAGLDQRRHARPSVSAPTSVRRRSATAATCSSRPACRPTRRRWPRSGARGTTSSTSASSTRRRRPSPPARTSSTAPRASSPPRSTRATRRTPTPTASPTSRTATACRPPGATPARPRRTASPPGCSSSPPAWNKAFSSGAFAALACPTWMMGYIQGQAGDAYAGKWDIAPVLPGGATNWGGSWLGVPTKAARTRPRRSRWSSGCRPRTSR